MKRIMLAAEHLRRKYGGRSIFETAENSGVNVWFRELGSLKGFYICENNSRYIIINDKLDELMSKTVCAHELGHDALHRELSAGGIREQTLFLDGNKTEREANLFAAEMLISDREAMEAAEYCKELSQAAWELSVLPEILEYKLEMLNFKGYKFNVEAISSDFLKTI